MQKMTWMIGALACMLAAVPAVGQERGVDYEDYGYGWGYGDWEQDEPQLRANGELDWDYDWWEGHYELDVPADRFSEYRYLQRYYPGSRWEEEWGGEYELEVPMEYGYDEEWGWDGGEMYGDYGYYDYDADAGFDEWYDYDDDYGDNGWDWNWFD